MEGTARDAERVPRLAGRLGGWTAEAEEYRELDDERVLVMTTSSGRGKSSGMKVGQMGYAHGANLFHLRDGKVTAIVTYWNREDAFADPGLTPEGDP